MQIIHTQVDVAGSAELTAETMADLVRVDTGQGDGEVVLPCASDVLGRRVAVRKVAGSGSVVVYAHGVDTLNGLEDSLTIGSNDPPVTLQAVRTGSGETFGWECI